MSFFGKNKKAVTTASNTTPVVTIGKRGSTIAQEIADEDPTNGVAVMDEATVPTDVPPWAVPGCKACKGVGINQLNEPCKACDVVSGRTGGVTSSSFETWVDDAGDLRWKKAGGQATQPARKAEAAKAEAKVQEKAPEAPKQAPKAETAPKTTDAPKAKETTKKTTKTTVEEPKRPVATGFDLYVGCFPVGHPKTITLSEVLFREGQEFAESQDMGSYYQINAFERRDALASQAKEIAESLKGYALLCPGATITPDERNLLAALEPFATFKVVTLV